MANKEHLSLIKQGVTSWNQWRKENSSIKPDLSGADLSSADLSGANLRGANLRWATLRRTNFQGANLDAANLDWVDLAEANACQASFKGASLRNADLHGSTLSKTNFRNANLSESILWNADLSHACLRGTYFVPANLHQASLKSALYDDKTTFFPQRFDPASHSMYKIEPGAKLSGLDLSDADLSGADLREADLSKANLQRADLREADLSETNLGWTNLRGANLRKTNLTKALGKTYAEALGKTYLLETDLSGAIIDEWGTIYRLYHAFDATDAAGLPKDIGMQLPAWQESPWIWLIDLIFALSSGIAVRIWEFTPWRWFVSRSQIRMSWREKYRQSYQRNFFRDVKNFEDLNCLHRNVKERIRRFTAESIAQIHLYQAWGGIYDTPTVVSAAFGHFAILILLVGSIFIPIEVLFYPLSEGLFDPLPISLNWIGISFISLFLYLCYLYICYYLLKQLKKLSQGISKILVILLPIVPFLIALTLKTSFELRFINQGFQWGFSCIVAIIVYLLYVWIASSFVTLNYPFDLFIKIILIFLLLFCHPFLSLIRNWESY